MKLTLANSFNCPILITFELQLQSTPGQIRQSIQEWQKLNLSRQPLKDLNHYVLFKTERITSNTLKTVFHKFFTCFILQYFFPKHVFKVKKKQKNIHIGLLKYCSKVTNKTMFVTQLQYLYCQQFILTHKTNHDIVYKSTLAKIFYRKNFKN